MAATRATVQRLWRRGVLEDFEVLATLRGDELAGMRYTPPFDHYVDHAGAHVVATADYVTTEDGTGIVHTAPAFGADDFETAKRVGVEMGNPVRRDGHFEVVFFNSIELRPNKIAGIASREFRWPRYSLRFFCGLSKSGTTFAVKKLFGRKIIMGRTFGCGKKSISASGKLRWPRCFPYVASQRFWICLL